MVQFVPPCWKEMIRWWVKEIKLSLSIFQGIPGGNPFGIIKRRDRYWYYIFFKEGGIESKGYKHLVLNNILNNI